MVKLMQGLWQSGGGGGWAFQQIILTWTAAVGGPLAASLPLMSLLEGLGSAFLRACRLALDADGIRRENFCRRLAGGLSDLRAPASMLRPPWRGSTFCKLFIIFNGL